jgi:MFS family permease
MISFAQVKTHFQTTTFSALYHPNFRLYFAGQLVSVSGTWMQTVAQGWLVFHLTRSELWLGVVACAAGVPSLLFSPLAGLIVDRMSRRRILFITQTTQMLLALMLSLLTFADAVQVWHVVVLAFGLGLANTFDAPARQTFIIDMVGRDDLRSGITLNSMMVSSARIFGPTAAGLTLASMGPAWCFFINAASFLAVIISLHYIQAVEIIKCVGEFAPLKQLKEGLRFAGGHATIAPLLLLAAICSIFTLNIITLLPAFADRALHSPIEGYAALSTAQGVGAVIAAVLFGPFAARYGRGRLITLMLIFTPLMMLLASRATDVFSATIFMALASFGLIAQFICVNTMIQTEVTNELRGRIVSLYTLTLFGMAPFGALALGLLAGHMGTPDAMALYAVLGGVLSLAIIFRAPQVRHLP